LAIFLLEHFGPALNQEALAGDLLEWFQEGRSNRWYWRQVLAAIPWRRHFYWFLMYMGGAWLCTEWNNALPISRLWDMSIFTAAFFVLDFLPRMLRMRKRILLAVLAALFLVWLFQHDRPLYGHYSVLGFLLANNLLFYKQVRPGLTPPWRWRELLIEDPEAERKRLIEKLQLDLMQETDPALRHAYEESIAALQRNASPGMPKSTE
jgi:hypothetical protein